LTRLRGVAFALRAFLARIDKRTVSGRLRPLISSISMILLLDFLL
jgi:hypothetical protein